MNLRARHPHRHLRIILLFVSVVLVAMPALAEVRIDMEVDATELPRHLIHAKLRIPCEPGKLVLWYPKWIPGIHAPGGPVQNLAGFRVSTRDGTVVPWRRDDGDHYRFYCDVPEGVEAVDVEIDYIVNQPTVNSRGADVQGNASVAYINWNTCLVYPDGVTNDDLRVKLSVRLPKGWRYATALRTDVEVNGWVRFQPATLRTIVDSPMIGGVHFRTISLTSKDSPQTNLHLASESPSALLLDDAVISKYRKLIVEAEAMFGALPYDQYDFLVTCSDQIGRHGLEHRHSSLNGVRERELIDEKLRRRWVANLLPHEYVHLWCGKLRRPRGMATNDYHTPKQTRLLWIYEGLAEYLGEVLMIRCGLDDQEYYLEWLANTISGLNNKRGRRWRNLEDTAIASSQLRAPSRHWNSLRRDQDYYFEGALYWMEVDAIIRQESGGTLSLDDFCKRFFGKYDASTNLSPYELDDVYAALNSLIVYDWPGFFDRRVYTVQDELPLDVVSRCGYRLEYSTTPSSFLKDFEERNTLVYLGDSVGMTANSAGRIFDVVPGSPADQAGLAPGMEVIGVNSRKFSEQRLRDGVAESVTRRQIELLTLEGDRFRTLSIKYAGGPRYLMLVRDSNKLDVLKQILRAKAPTAPD